MAPFFIGLLSVLLGIVSVLIVLIVLMQRPKQEGLGAAFGGGMTDQMFGAQTSNVLQKGTVYLAVMFFIFSLILSVLTAKSVREDTESVENLASGKGEVEAPIDEIPGGSGITTPPIQIPSQPAPTPIPTPAPETKPEDAKPEPDKTETPAPEVETETPAVVEEVLEPVEEVTPVEEGEPVEEVVPAEEPSTEPGE